MGMNIKNKEAYQLTKQLAKLTGESLTTAVTEAVRERLDQFVASAALMLRNVY